MAAPYAHDLFLLHEPALSRADEAFVRALALALREQDLRVACPLTDLQAGEDRDAWLSRTLRDSAWTVVVRTGRSTPAFRALVNRAVAWQQAEPAVARVIPLRRRGAPEEDEVLSGLEVLVALEVEDRSASQVAMELHRVAEARLLRTLRRGSLKVAVLGDSQELGPELDAALTVARTMRGRVWQTERVCVREQDAPARVAAADVVVVVLGASTAGLPGAEVLVGALTHRAALLLAMEDVPRSRWKAWPTDRELADGLRDRILDELGGLPFQEPADLRVRLAPALGALLDRLDPPQGESAGGLSEGERAYLLRCWPGWKEGRHKDLAEARGRGGCELRRDSLYVHLRGEDPRLFESRTVVWPEYSKQGPMPMLDQVVSNPVFRHLAVLGEAGTGKTVLLQHLATVLGAAVDPSLALPAAGEEPAHHLDLGALAAPDGSPPLPVLVEARHLVPHLGNGGPDQAVPRMLADLLDLNLALVKGRLFAGRLLLLVDSLDEVPGEHRGRVLEALTQFAREPRCRSRIVLSSRPLAHTGVEIGAPFAVTRIAPLDEDRQSALLSRWCAAQRYSEDRGAALRNALHSLAGQFEHNAADGLLPHQNPLLLTCICIVFDNGDRLPENRAALYDRMVDILVRARLPDLRPGEPPREMEKPESRERVLKALMLAMQRAGQTALSFIEAREIVAADLGLLGQDSRAERALMDLANSTGLVRVEAGSGGLRPWHRSFQEYLAARALAGDPRGVEELVDELCRDGGEALDPGWTGCLEFLTATIGDRAKAEVFVRTLLARSEGSPAREARLLALAAAGVAEYRLERFQGSDVPAEVVKRIHQRFGEAGAEWPWQDRLAALDGLGRLGDPRFPNPREDNETGWVYVPGRLAPVGEPGEARAVEIPDLWVRAWPVLVSEYLPFVEEGGKEAPPGWAEQRRHPNRPVVRVSWFDARAFARWAQGSPKPWLLPGPGRLDLLTGDQWVAVARGPGNPEDTWFPWGREDPGCGDQAKACHRWEPASDGSLRSAQAVGAFPLGNKRAYGVPLLDLAGNVTEWCATEHEGPDVQHDEARSASAHAMLGGSWGDRPWSLRCSYFVGCLSTLKIDTLGFRLCVSVSPSRS